MTYKAPNGNWYTIQLFYDVWKDIALENRLMEPVFAFDTDRPGMINCKKTFVELGDPTGYKWAVKYLESWDHWLYLMKREWFQQAFEAWQEELLTKMKAEAILKISALTGSANPAQALTAAKYIAEHGWEKQTKGRPSKERVQGELKKHMKDAEQTSEDMRRLGLTVIQGKNQ